MNRGLSPLILLLARLALVLSLAAPHAGHAGPHPAGGGLTMVICGAAGVYEITLDAPVPPAPEVAHDPCCMMGCPGLPAATAFAPGAWPHPAAPPLATAPPPSARLTDAPNARDPPMTR